MKAWIRPWSLPVVMILLLMASCTGDTMVATDEADFKTGRTQLEAGKKEAPPVLNPANGNYYQAVADPAITWSAARAAADAMKHRGCVGHLATITSEQENAFIADNFPEAIQVEDPPGSNEFIGGYWLGGAQDPLFGEPGGGWGWITGEPFIYTNWDLPRGEPNDADGNENALHFAGLFQGPDVEAWNDIDGENETVIAGPGFKFVVGGYVVEYDCPPNGPVLERVSGSGHFTVEGELRTFSFNARKYADGTVRGEYQQNNRAVDAKKHGNVTCFVSEGNQVWLGGVEDMGTDTAPYNEVGWTVVDNGEGAGSPPDQISLKWVDRPPGFASAYCTATPAEGELFGLPLNDVESGNIQIQQ